MQNAKKGHTNGASGLRERLSDPIGGLSHDPKYGATSPELELAKKRRLEVSAEIRELETALPKAKATLAATLALGGDATEPRAKVREIQQQLEEFADVPALIDAEIKKHLEAAQVAQAEAKKAELVECDKAAREAFDRFGAMFRAAWAGELGDAYRHANQSNRAYISCKIDNGVVTATYAYSSVCKEDPAYRNPDALLVNRLEAVDRTIAEQNRERVFPTPPPAVPRDPEAFFRQMNPPR